MAPSRFGAFSAKTAGMTTLAFFTMAIACLAADWSFSSPITNSDFKESSSVSGTGQGVEDAAFFVAVRVNGGFENTTTSTCSPIGSWMVTVPTPADDHKWTVSEEAFLVIVYDDTEHLRPIDIIPDDPGEA